MKLEQIKDQPIITKGGHTFLVEIKYQAHSTWQGTVRWMGADKTVPFRSMLELIHLIDSALNTTPKQ